MRRWLQTEQGVVAVIVLLATICAGLVAAAAYPTPPSEARVRSLPYYPVNDDLIYVYDRVQHRCFLKMHHGWNGYWGDTGIAYVGVTAEAECR